jgi:DNA-directed RNA polymerase subunit RPC12/RpoP
MSPSRLKKMFTEFRCQRCGRTFKTEAELAEHVKEHVEKGPVTCGKCGKQFYSEEEALKHFKEHSREEAMLAKETDLEIEKYKERLQNIGTLYAEGKLSEQSYLLTAKTIEKKLDNLNKSKGYSGTSLASNPSVYSDFEEREEIVTKQVDGSIAIWYLAPLLLGLIGALIGYIAVKDRDPEMANNILIVGVGITILGIIVL